MTHTPFLHHLQSRSVGDNVFYIDSVDELNTNCGKNLLSKALLVMQRALLMPKSGTNIKEQEQQLQVSN